MQKHWLQQVLVMMDDLHKLNYIFNRCKIKYKAEEYEPCDEDCEN